MNSTGTLILLKERPGSYIVIDHAMNAISKEIICNARLLLIKEKMFLLFPWVFEFLLKSK